MFSLYCVFNYVYIGGTHAMSHAVTKAMESLFDSGKHNNENNLLIRMSLILFCESFYLCAVNKKDNYNRAYTRSLQIYLQLWLRDRGYNAPSEISDASSDIFNTDYLWEYGAKGLG